MVDFCKTMKEVSQMFNQQSLYPPSFLPSSYAASVMSTQSQPAQPQMNQNPNPNGKNFACFGSSKVVKEIIYSKDAIPSKGLLTIDAEVNQYGTKILLDTGSNRTVVSSYLVEELKLQVQTIPKGTGATGVGGRIEFIGQVKFQLTIGPCTREIIAAVARHDQLFEDCTFLALIGFNTMAVFPECSINAKDKILTIDGVKIPIGDASSFYRVHLLNTCRIPKGSGKCVELALPEEAKSNCDGLHIEALETAEIKHNIKVNPAIIDADGKISVLIENSSDKNIVLQAGTVVAKATRIKNTDDPNVVMHIDGDDSFLGYLQGFQ